MSENQFNPRNYFKEVTKTLTKQPLEQILNQVPTTESNLFKKLDELTNSSNSQYKTELVSKELKDRIQKEPNFLNKYTVFFSSERGFTTLPKVDESTVKANELEGLSSTTQNLINKGYRKLN